ncbi:sensor histidine kinase [Oerskovia sp. Root22]|uniref:sensor histidine kinase n=1 Tax=Oerskovia sp. Root22 TaxID=1736494 RepID=UPI0012F98F4D|nr:histidine kinase [Oerskovia sp. Root22]
MTRANDAARAALPAPLRGLGMWAWVIAGVFLLTLFVLGLALGSMVHGMPLGAALIATLLLTGSIVVALERPVTGAVLHVAGVFTTALFSTGEPWPAPVVTILALVAMLLVLATVTRWWVSVGTWAVACLGLVVIAGTTRPADDAVGNLIVTASVTLATLSIGLLLMAWSRASTDLDEARFEAQQEHAARAWAEERARVAREMHDVVAHSMSIVHMRATSAKYRVPALSDAAVAEFDGIAVQAREALGEMRGVLGVLRGDDVAQFAPQPGIAQLLELVDGARAAEIDLSARIDTIEPNPPESVQLALYRVAQEAVANIARHAPSATACLTVEAGEHVVLTITSRGAPSAEAPDRGGSGIRGMIERMTAIGGTLTAGPVPGGFEVVATAPRGTA